MTYIVSDANVESLVLDIRLDLPQILGRQRLEENPWKNECIVFYKVLDNGKQITKEEFMENIDRKIKESEDILSDFSTAKQGTKNALYHFVKDDYREGVGQTKCYLYIDQNGLPAFDTFLQLAEIRAWELTQYEYKNNISVIASIGDLSDVEVQQYTPGYEREAQDFIDEIKSIKHFDNRLRRYCEFREYNKENSKLTDRVLLYFRGTDLENLYSYFGIDRCKASRFRADELKELLINDINTDSLRFVLNTKFVLGKWYSMKEIKETLRESYKLSGINKNPKATDLQEYYQVVERQVTDKVSKKRVNGYELISIK